MWRTVLRAVYLSAAASLPECSTIRPRTLVIENEPSRADGGTTWTSAAQRSRAFRLRPRFRRSDTSAPPSSTRRRARRGRSDHLLVFLAHTRRAQRIDHDDEMPRLISASCRAPPRRLRRRTRHRREDIGAYALPERCRQPAGQLLDVREACGHHCAQPQAGTPRVVLRRVYLTLREGAVLEQLASWHRHPVQRGNAPCTIRR